MINRTKLKKSTVYFNIRFFVDFFVVVKNILDIFFFLNRLFEVRIDRFFCFSSKIFDILKMFSRSELKMCPVEL
jgi:hypothetical protein